MISEIFSLWGMNRQLLGMLVYIKLCERYSWSQMRSDVEMFFQSVLLRNSVNIYVLTRRYLIQKQTHYGK